MFYRNFLQLNAFQNHFLFVYKIYYSFIFLEKKSRTILSYFCFVFAGSLKGSYWASERLLDDIMIRKFVEGVLHDFLKSEVVIKRKANRINLVFIVSKEGDLTKFYFLVGFTEKLLSELLGCVVKIEPQSAFQQKQEASWGM